MEVSQKLEVSTPSRHTQSEANVSICGLILLIFVFISFSGFLYAAVLSKLLPPSGNMFISAVQSDRYYCLLVPLTLPILVVVVYLHWLSMKLFKHA